MQNTSPEKIQKDTLEKIIEEEWKEWDVPVSIEAQYNGIQMNRFTKNVLARYNQNLSAKVQARKKDLEKFMHEHSGELPDEDLSAYSAEEQLFDWFLKILEENKMEKLVSASSPRQVPRKSPSSVVQTMIKGDSE